MAKGELAYYILFLRLSQCFQKSSDRDASEYLYKRENVKSVKKNSVKNLTNITLEKRTTPAIDIIIPWAFNQYVYWNKMCATKHLACR